MFIEKLASVSCCNLFMFSSNEAANVFFEVFGQDILASNGLSDEDPQKSMPEM